jgi:hypothetical protein
MIEDKTKQVPAGGGGITQFLPPGVVLKRGYGTEIANTLGLTSEWVNDVLSGRKKPKKGCGDEWLKVVAKSITQLHAIDAERQKAANLVSEQLKENIKKLAA